MQYRFSSFFIEKQQKGILTFDAIYYILYIAIYCQYIAIYCNSIDGGGLKGIAIGMGGGGSHNTIAIYC